jgi:hypothetical protein
MKLYRITLTVEMEAENEDDAMQQAMRLDDTVILFSVTLVEDNDNAPSSDRS